MKKCLKWIIISAVLAGAGYGIYVWTSSGEKDEFTYRTVKVVKSDIVRTVRATGPAPLS